MNPYVYSRNRRVVVSQPAGLVSLLKSAFNSAISPVLAFAIVALAAASAGSVAWLAYSEMSQPSELPLAHNFINNSQTKVLGDSTTNFYPYSTGSLVNDQGTVYFISGDTKVPFTDWQTFTGLGYSAKNITNGNLANYRRAQTYTINNANSAHPWGSWVIYKNTVYYVSESGLIGVPSIEVFISNGGDTRSIVKANSYDIEVLNSNPNLPVLVDNDSRAITAPSSGVPISNPPPSAVDNGGSDSLLPKTSTSTVTARVGQLVNLNGTVYLVGSNGLYGFPNLNTLTSWGYSTAQALPANAQEQSLPQAGVVPQKQGACSGILDQLAGKCGSAPAAGSARTVSLTANKVSFCVYSQNEHQNDTIQYTVKGSPDLANLQIVWSSTLNSTSTQENNAYYGQSLGADASWTFQTLSWPTSYIGTWSKTVSILKNGEIVATSQPLNFVVKDCSTESTAKPVISGVQGMSNGSYTSTISSNQYLVVYGYFTPSGNVVIVNNKIYTPTYQNSSQINVLLGTFTGSVASVQVSNANGSSATSQITIAGQTGSTTASSSVVSALRPVVSGLQGYTSNGYTSTITSNGYLVLYGSFAGQGDSVTVNGVTQSVTYDSKTQINVQLGTIAAGSANVIVTNSSGSADPHSIQVVDAPTSSALTVTPSSLNFKMTLGGNYPDTQMVSINPGSATAAWVAKIESNSSNGIFNLNLSGGNVCGTGVSICGTGPLNIVVSMAFPYSAGTYTNNILITSGGQTKTVVVTLLVENSSITANNGGVATALSCSADATSANIGDYVKFTHTGGNGTYFWSNNGNASVGYGSDFILSFSSSGDKTITLTSGGQTATCAVTIKSPATGLKPSGPTISGLQGYGSSGYTTTISSNQYLILYGSFAGSGDSVSVNGVAQTVTYDSTTQINVQLGTIAASTAAVTVTNSNGSANGNIAVAH